MLAVWGVTRRSRSVSQACDLLPSQGFLTRRPQSASAWNAVLPTEGAPAESDKPPSPWARREPRRGDEETLSPCFAPTGWQRVL